MRASIRPRRTTEKAASWPLISGSLVGNKSSWLGGSVTLDQILAHQESSALFGKMVRRWRSRSHCNPRRPKVTMILQLREVMLYPFRMQSQMIGQVIQRDIGIRPGESDENLLANVIRLIRACWYVWISTKSGLRISRLQVIAFIVLERDHVLALRADVTVWPVTGIAPVSQCNVFVGWTVRCEVSIPQSSKSVVSV
jgi:hypothetical protein